MLEALTFAFVDSINVLLIGVVAAIGVSLPARDRLYPRVAALLICGDWLGVFSLALVTLFVFDGIGDAVKHFVDSPWFGALLIAAGLLIGLMALRGGSNSQLIDRILRPLQQPSALTMLTGFILGLAQSATSGPFFGGLAVLSAEGLTDIDRYLGLVFYASVALSLPTLSAIAVGLVRNRPRSTLGSAVLYAREHPEKVARNASYVVAALLVVLGLIYTF
ncbi:MULTISPECIES: hypothetical protein [Corynebacterium]|uniref:hypothetical protein n=1 Tax=Corynebacterium TaxID=1716 RepID=UPI00124DB056|nr:MULTISPECIES: hypothetical protein [Corynebacterium]